MGRIAELEHILCNFMVIRHCQKCINNPRCPVFDLVDFVHESCPSMLPQHVYCLSEPPTSKGKFLVSTYLASEADFDSESHPCTISLSVSPILLSVHLLSNAVY